MSNITDNWNKYLKEVRISSLEEDWQHYQARSEVLENYPHITKVLGIPVPLAEDGTMVLDAELERKILSEQILYESWMDSLKNYVKSKARDTADGMANLFKSVYKIMRNSETIGPFVGFLESEVIAPLKEKIVSALESLKQLPEKTKEGIENLIQYAYDFFANLTLGWKKVLAAITVAVLFKKVSKVWKTIKIKAGLEGYELVKKLLGKDTLKRAVESGTFEKWLGHMAGVVGTVMSIAMTLGPATEKFVAQVQEQTEGQR